MFFEQFFNEHVRYVGRALRYLGVKESDLEDACQEVFIVVHRRRGELAPQGDDVEPRARAWIRQICVNVASNARRTVRRRREDALESGDEAAHAATQESHVEREQMRGRLLALLETLREEQRTVFVLYEIEQLAMQEIASIVGCPVQTAYARLHAARARVAEGLQGVSAKHKEPS
jgi:RNA polymerase sigma-70 factor (ECF subfamily)